MIRLHMKNSTNYCRTELDHVATIFDLLYTILNQTDQSTNHVSTLARQSLDSPFPGDLKNSH